ncbi:30S ribosomal protein S6 [Anaerorhabdus furcosa]|uniref:Small ribosomal subunit protein bS6 n=1 Tax=Anaerorhabdus furcosa TaxID=118967 RepID=A0A1T4K5K4_9FIRM|nr:30S ribosomal protein S6 [Anaerorhabdus furcosa]SJZ37709.1 small subunit ribosomal protein S6 [Anaerorhabdus furcosa]
MRKYEVMYIVNASLEDAKRQEVIESMHGIITNGGGKIVNVDEWGVKEFAYRIEDMTKGYYMVVTFEADNETVKEFERLMRINANIVRFMIVKQDEN